MFELLQTSCVVLVSLAMALSVAHALELPGKLRLDRDTYIAVQTIYYPGFTIGGMVGDAGGTIATLVLLIVTPVGAVTFGWTLAAMIGMIAMNAVFWIVTQPANRFWMREMKLHGAAGKFFAFDPLKRRAESGETGELWLGFRKRWELSHVVRASLATVSLIALVIGLVLE